jgi:hypothetical protein
MKNLFTLVVLIGLLLPNVLLAALPSDLHFQYDRDGGLYPESTHIDLSLNGGVYQHFFNGTEQKVFFSVSEKEMNSLNNTFRWYFFNSINTKTKNDVYDRSGDSISMVIGAKNITKSNTGKSYINGTLSRWRYTRIANAIQKFAEQKLSSSLKPFRIEVEDHLTKYTVLIAINGKRVDNLNDVKILPGTSELNIGLYDKKNNWVAGDLFVIDSDETTIARIQVRDKDISVSTE